MSLHLSKLTTKFQATLPKAVRMALHVKSHDYIAYELQDDQTVIIRRASPLDIEYYKALSQTLSEWESEADEKAFKHLRN